MNKFLKYFLMLTVFCTLSCISCNKEDVELEVVLTEESQKALDDLEADVLNQLNTSTTAEIEIDAAKNIASCSGYSYHYFPVHSATAKQLRIGRTGLASNNNHSVWLITYKLVNGAWQTVSAQWAPSNNATVLYVGPANQNYTVAYGYNNSTTEWCLTDSFVW